MPYTLQPAQTNTQSHISANKKTSARLSKRKYYLSSHLNQSHSHFPSATSVNLLIPPLLHHRHLWFDFPSLPLRSVNKAASSWEYGAQRAPQGFRSPGECFTVEGRLVSINVGECAYATASDRVAAERQKGRMPVGHRDTTARLRIK